MELQEIKNEVFKRRPVLEEIGKEYGNLALYEYVNKAWRVPNLEVDPVFLRVFQEQTEVLFGTETAIKAKNQLLEKPLVTTIEHHGVWGHPIFVNSALIYSLAFKSEEFAIALSTESVSLNNTSSWSGCFLETSEKGLKRFSLFSDQQKILPVFSCPAFREIKPKFYKEIPDLENLITGILDLPSFSAQASKITYRLWQKVFPTAPKLLYIPLESLVLKYLQALEEDHLLAELIFSNHGRELWKKYFTGEHTFMFWGLDFKGRRVVLTSLPEKEKLLELIKQKQIYPSSPLCFVVLLISGLACAGGFTQTTWLTKIKEKFEMLLKEWGREDSIKNIVNMPTKNFAESSLAYLQNGKVNTMPTSLDLLKLNKDLYSDYKTRSKEITLKQSLDLAMPGIYEVVV